MGIEKIMVLGLSPTAKYVGKEASLFNIKCLAFDFKNGAANYSNCFESTEILPQAALLVKLKNTYLNDGVTYYICPTSDEWIEFISLNKTLFVNSNLKTSSSYLDDTFNLLADKFQLMNLSNISGLNYPKSIAFIPHNDNIPDLSSFDFPIFVKPSNRAGLATIMQGRKGWLFNSDDEWRSSEVLKKLQGISLLIQEVIIGPESNIKVLATVALNGEKSDTWVGIKYRQYPVGFGSASLVLEDNEDRELALIAEELLSVTKYSGFFALETKYCDKRKKTYIIEVNTRPGLWFGATTSANYWLVAKWCTSLGFKLQEFTGKKRGKKYAPIVWRYFYKDLFISIKHKPGYASKIVLPKEKINSYAVFDKHDLKPFIFDLCYGFKKIIGNK